MNKVHAQKIFILLKSHYPHAGLVLKYGNHFELLTAIILSAQCTDKKVNEVTAVLFPKYRKEFFGFAHHYANYTRIHIAKQELIELVNFAFVPLSELEL